MMARLLEDDNLSDPHPLLARTRDSDPVPRTPAGDYLLIRHADIVTALESFRSPEPEEIDRLFPVARRHRSAQLLANTILMQNPPKHTRLRRLLGRGLTPKQVQKLRDGTTRYCARLVDQVEERLRSGETVNLSEALSLPLSKQVLADLIGYPEADRAWLFGLPPVTVAMAPGTPEDMLTRADETSKQIEDYVAGLVEQRRREPKDDLLTAWLRVHEDGDAFTHDELLSMHWGVLLAGLETTAAAHSCGLLAMVRHPDQASWLGRDDRSVLAFVNEALRHESPTFIDAAPLYPVEDIELGDVPLPAGAKTHVVFAAGNRDPEVFSDPDRFDPSRDNTRMLAFGHGRHHCMGIHVARMELTSLLTAVHRRLPKLQLADKPTWHRSVTVRHIDNLPVAL
jgi:cytochrome P450